MRRTPSIIALLGAALACGVLAVLLAVELRASTPATSPRAAIAAAAADRAQARIARFEAQDRTWNVPYDDGMVRDRSRWSIQGGAPTLDVTVVNATPGADLVETARRCVAAQPRATRVQCYAFASSEAYEFKNLTADIAATGASGTAIVNLCWAALASNERAGGPVTRATDMRDATSNWEAQQCPDSWKGAKAS
jgi:hypothetical protein